LIALGIGIAPAHAEGTASTFVVDGTVGADGTLQLSETITFDGAAPSQFTQQIPLTDDRADYTYYRFEVSGVSATANGSTLSVDQSQNRDVLTLTVDSSKAGSNPVTLSYTVKGASVQGGMVDGNNALTHISWPVLQGLSFDVAQASGQVSVPGIVSAVNCQSGAVSGLQPCVLWQGGTHDYPQPYFQATNLKAGQAVVFSFDTAASSVAANESVGEHWTLDRAFSTGAGQLFAALAVLIAGAVALFFVRRLAVRGAQDSVPATQVAVFSAAAGGSGFRVQGDLRPGLVGTLSDERVDPVDVASTIVDLAVRGHLRIIELASTNPHVPLDWTFERLTGPDDLQPYEQTLLDVIAPVEGPAVRVSEIGNAVETVIPAVHHQLYDAVVARGWFGTRPDNPRTRAKLLSWALLAAAVLGFIALAAFTKFGLTGLVLIGLAVVFVAMARQLPRKTLRGRSLLRGLHELAAQLQTFPFGQIPKQNAYKEISQVLPYAVVLGARERWVAALADADNDPGVPDPDDLPWYHAGPDWQLSDLPAAFDAFIANVEGRLYGRS
jgi:hypothetical protein